MSTKGKATATPMKGGVRRRKEGGGWSYVVDMGRQPAQRCRACGRREWIALKPLPECPRCGGFMRETKERRQVYAGGFETSKEAEVARAVVVARLDRGGRADVNSRMSLAEYLGRHWLPAIEAEDLRPNTREGYERHCREHIVGPKQQPFPLGTMKLRELNLAAIREHYRMLGSGYVSDRRGKLVEKPGLSRGTVRRVHATLHRALNDAVEAGILSDNPAWRAARRLKQLEAPKPRVQTWTPAELASFLAATAQAELGPLWHFYAVTGCRRGEALALRWGDVDFEAGCVHVSRSRTPVKGGVEEGATKTGAEKVVTLEASSVELLRRVRAEQREKRPVVELDDRAAYVFAQEDGRPLDPNRMSREFREAVEAAKLPRIRLHDLRHTHGSVLASLGFSAADIAARLGHASARTTMEFYIHSLPNAQEAAADRFAEAIRAATQ